MPGIQGQYDAAPYQGLWVRSRSLRGKPVEVYIRISVDSVHFWYDSGGISLSGVENCYIAYRSDNYIISSCKLGTVKSE